MTNDSGEILTGKVFNESTEITVVELCETCSVDRAVVEDMIAEGILEPVGHGDKARVPYKSVRRTLTVVRLQRDLGVNLAGAALALDLLDQIEELRTRLRQRRTL